MSDARSAMPAETREIFRFAGAAIAACAVVAVILVVSLWSFGFLDRPKGHHAVDIRLLTLSERLDLAEMLGEKRQDGRPSLPPLDEIPPLEIPRHKSAGFVQVEFSVDAQGRVTDAHVVRSVPEGLFEQQALEIVRSREYAPDESGRRTDVVNFTVENEGQ